MFCEAIRETDSKMDLQFTLRGRLELDPNFTHIDTADLLELARQRFWTLERLMNNFKKVDRALLIALLRKGK